MRPGAVAGTWLRSPLLPWLRRLLLLPWAAALAGPCGNRSACVDWVAGVEAPLWVPAAAAGQLGAAGRLRVRPLGDVCGGAGSSEMDVAVQPPCAGHVCEGPTERSGSEVGWQGVRIVRPGNYRLCWCEPNEACAAAEEGCCPGDANFSQERA
ncbi:unnamed protein product, partial [Prorocentrum cordatum]